MLFGHQNNDANKSAQPAPAAPTLNPLAIDPTTGVSLPVAPEEPTGPDVPEAPSVLNQAAGDQTGEQTFAGVPLPPPPAPAPMAPPTTAPLTDVTSEPAQPEAPTEPQLPPPAEVITPTPEPSPEPVMPLDELASEPVAEPISEPTPQIAEPSVEPEPAMPEPEPVMLLDQPTEEPAMPPTEPPAPSTAEAMPAALPTTEELLELKQHALAQLSPLVDQLDQTPEEKFRTKMMMIQSTDDQSLIREAYEIAQSIPDEKVRAQALLDVINEINYFTAQQS